VDQSHGRIYLFSIFGTANVPETGEIGALSSIVNTHWSLLYWEPMRAYFQKGEVSA
jgi:hypothetical protein